MLGTQLEPPACQAKVVQSRLEKAVPTSDSKVKDSRVALVTGGVRGIGRAIALTLAEIGWSVAVCYRTSADAAASLETEILARGVRSMNVRAERLRPRTSRGSREPG